MTTIQLDYFPIKLKEIYHQFALKFAQEQDTTEKGKQVYYNTLAVSAINDLITEDFGFTTDINQSYSWNIAERCFRNVADVFIPEIGRIECLPILEDKTKIIIPKEAREDRIAYVVVQFLETLDRVHVLGFYPNYYPDDHLTEINLDQLTPIEELIDYLFKKEMINDDEVTKKVKDRLNTESFSEIVADLERILRNYEPYQWREKIINLVEINPTFASVREHNLTKDSDELVDLTEELLEKLAEIWEIDC